MKTNKEKWDYYMSILDKKTNDFIETITKVNDIPECFYFIYPSGNLVKRTLKKLSYSHYKHDDSRVYFSGKTPTKIDVAELKKYSESEIPFDNNNVFYEYSEIWDVERNLISSSAVKLFDVINEVNIFKSLEKAEECSKNTLEEYKKRTEFLETHKKDISYNYSANGYNFLGWQNGWSHVYFDEDGNLCSESGKPRRSFGYSKEQHPEYRNCVDSKHTRIEISHNNRGSENTVSCPLCKIYWKYDCSD